MRECHCFCLQRRVCTLVVALCALHISVMVFYYLRNSGADGHMQVQAYSTSSPNTTNIELVSPAATTAALIAEPRAEDVAEVTEEANGVEAFKTPLEKCPETCPLLVGPLCVEFSDPVDLEQIRQEPLLVEGGHYKPPQCSLSRKWPSLSLTDTESSTSNTGCTTFIPFCRDNSWTMESTSLSRAT
ncbi:beta-1,4-galactosyltransferase 1-like isoform X2 [Electrophorus electricus]|uniref:beta-1,4-galactosyltransferase 1-like isoform X2 n=1 Tax=Electrophorus electricus TaxID=8005 RepID=UPI0015CFAAAA|nr:beta-1,4-galactosyltransferase 1-like isoform X2 [Electrophorus electricus]